MPTFKRFVILSGPSCVGKGPLQRAVNRFYPGKLRAPVLCTSRPRRTHEKDGEQFYFLPESFIRSLEACADFVVAPVRTDWQAVYLIEVEQLLDSHDLVFAEVFYTFGETLRKKAAAKDVSVSSVFLVPMQPGAPPAEIVSVMRGKLDRRDTDAEDKKRERSEGAPQEIEASTHYTHVILNPAGEDDIREWGEFGIEGNKPGPRPINRLDDLGPNAKWLVEVFVNILDGLGQPGFYCKGPEP